MTKPKVLDRHIAAQTQMFRVEAVDIEFSNGQKRTYERLLPGGAGAVMIAAITDQEEVLLIREYAVGVEDYILTLPGGKIDLGESSKEATNRELKEEVGFGAHNIAVLRKINLNPRYASGGITAMLAYDLYHESLSGDEPEPLDIIKWPLSRLSELLWRDDFNEGRAMATLILATDHYRSLKHSTR